jgi:signal transduction histidine kinase
MTRAPDETRLAQEEQRLAPGRVEALMPYGKVLVLEAGGVLFDEKSAVDSFYVVLEGELNISRLDGAEETSLVNHGAGEFTGGLAVLTGRTSVHRARALTPTRVLEIDSQAFRRVAAEVPDVADVFISGLARRMRQTQRAFRQQEKLAALGKLSAGLAHELNNPAAAARRASEELGGAVLEAQLAALEHDERFSPDERAALATMQSETTQGTSPLDPLLLSDAEDELADWLDEHGIGEPWDLAPTLTSAGVATGRLEALAGVLEDRSLAGGLGWLVKTVELVGLADEVATSAGRISELVGAMKKYTYMDRAAVGEVDVIAGLENTLTILGHKLKGVSLRREYAESLPTVQGNGGELNQVWTNLLDNAIDAVDGRGNITVRASAEAGRVVVEVVDDGPGIPHEARERVFEPFYTTKEVGAGTGLGLDVVRRIVGAHGGEVSVRSEPGETSFTVGLPLDTKRNGG